MNEFLELALNDNLIEILNQNNILVPTPIQKEAIPYLLKGEDVIGKAKTGTGKTFAYSLPLINNMEYGKRETKALILCPTRELSIQVKGEIDKLIKNTKFKCEAIYGGESYVIQNRKLKAIPDIIIGTPGRIIDQLNKGNLSFSNVKYLVLDEADEMLKMGFQDDLETILSNVPSERQTALFSATLPPFIKNIAKKYMQNPISIEIESKTLTVDLIDQQVYYCMKDSKKDLVIRLLDFYSFKHIMIFCNTKAMVDELSLFLKKSGFKVEGLHGDLKQQSRDKVMNEFRDSVINILIATDVAARGIDIDDIDCVINYDVPYENDLYVHRIGRTGRAGEAGIAITIATNHSKGRIRELEAFTKSKMNVHEIPSLKDLENMHQKNLYLSIKDSIEKNNDNIIYDKMILSLSKLDTNPIPLIRGLISMIDSKKREYPEIEVYKQKEKRLNNNSKNSGPKNKKKDRKEAKKDTNPFVSIRINLGEEDRVRPNQLVNLFHDELKIHREHFGKIKINKKYTIIDIKKEALRFLNSKKIKLNGKTINIFLDQE